MEEKYEIDFLIHKFNDHARIFRKNTAYSDDDFNLPLSLAVICEEIKKLKDMINERNNS